MTWIFEAISNRLKALFAADLANTFESQLASRQAERKAELLRQAERFEQEGLGSVAGDLREKAESICIERPLATVLPSIAELEKPSGTSDNKIPETINGSGPNRRPARISAKRKTARAGRRA